MRGAAPLLWLLALASCSDDGPAEAETGTSTMVTSGEGTSSGSTSGTGSTSSGVSGGSESGTAEATSDTSPELGSAGSSSEDTGTGEASASTGEPGSETATGGDAESETGTPDDGTILFRTEDPSAYQPVDRVGLPGVSHLHIASQDEYNRSTPVDDVERDFVAEVRDSIDALQIGEGVGGDGLRTELEDLGFVPCEPPEAEVLDPPIECNRQVYPHVIPDVLTLDLDVPNGFPNGRTLEDRAMDITLALVLLDLDEALLGFEDEDSQGGHPLEALFDIGGGVSLNPAQNDLPFSAEFPYLAPPHP